MTSYPTISFRDLIRRVEALGFQQIRQKGSHIRFSHPDGRRTTIPDHGAKSVPRGLLSKIIRYDLEIDQETFFKQAKYIFIRPQQIAIQMWGAVH